MDSSDAAGRAGILTARFDAAVAYAVEAHAAQQRKGTHTPYAAHLLGVASLVLEAGGSENEAIAGLLHDVVEDQGGAERLADVRARFGNEVAGIVLECSAEDKSDGATWRERKVRYVDGIATISTPALLVSLADKVYNARSMLDDYRAIGDVLWDRFGADEPKDESIRWYYGELITAYNERLDAPQRLLADLRRTIHQLEVLALRPTCPECAAGDVVLIGYGLPTQDDFEAAGDNGIEIGGCVINEESPNFRCIVCGATWLRADRERNPW